MHCSTSVSTVLREMLALTASVRFVRTLQPRRLLASLPHVVEHDGTRAERSLILLKPDAVERRLVGRILGRFEDRGLAVVALRQRTCDRALAEAHYAEHRDKHFFGRACAFLCAGPLVSACLEGRGAVAAARRLIGPTDPRDAPPGTIRGDLATHWRRNLVHASDSVASAERELALWFDAGDLEPVPPALDAWLYELPTSRIAFGDAGD